MVVILTLVHRVWEGWSSNLEPAKSYTGYKQIATAPIFTKVAHLPLCFVAEILSVLLRRWTQRNSTRFAVLRRV